MRFLELSLPSPDPHRQLEFYAETLGLAREGGAVRAGSTLVDFAPAPETPVAHFAFNVPENRLVEALEWLRPRAAPLEREGLEVFDFADWNAHAVYFTDPDGNVVELIARHAVPNASAESFGPRGFLEVSEVGLPVPDVGDAVAFLERELGTALWRGDREHFAAVGDGRTLFIVVPEERPWFPTDARGRASAIAVTVAAAAAGDLAVPGSAHTLRRRTMEIRQTG